MPIVTLKKGITGWKVVSLTKKNGTRLVVNKRNGDVYEEEDTTPVILQLTVPKGAKVWAPYSAVKIDDDGDFALVTKGGVPVAADKVRASSAYVEDVFLVGSCVSLCIDAVGFDQIDGLVLSPFCQTSSNMDYLKGLRSGKRVRPDMFDTADSQCSNGIHFFFTRKEAEKFSRY